MMRVVARLRRFPIQRLLTDSLMLPVLPNGGQHQGKNIFVDFRWRWKIQIHSSELQINEYV